MAGVKTTGRPSKFSEALVEEICNRISAGESLLKITEEKDKPDRVTIYRWIEENEDFRNKYARAKELQAETYEDMMLDAARTEQDVQRARLIVDTMKWTASKLKPKKYGDKIDVTSDGKALPQPISPLTIHFPDTTHDIRKKVSVENAEETQKQITDLNPI